MRAHIKTMIALTALAMLTAQQARADISLGDAANYVILQYNAANPGPTNVGGSQTKLSISGGNTTITGTIGTAANTKVNFSGFTSANVAGPWDQSTVNTGGSSNSTGLMATQSASIDTALNNAVQAAISASTAVGSAPVDHTFTSTFTGGETITALHNGQNVIDLAGGINMTGSTGITLSTGGFSNVSFVIKVDGQWTSNNGTSTTLGPGLTAKQVLWDYTGTSMMNISFTGGDPTHNEWDGTVLSQFAQITAHDRLFNGALIAGNDITITSNPVIKFQPFTPPGSPPPGTPEPSSMAMVLVIGGLSISGYAWRRRRSK